MLLRHHLDLRGEVTIPDLFVAERRRDSLGQQVVVVQRRPGGAGPQPECVSELSE